MIRLLQRLFSFRLGSHSLSKKEVLVLEILGDRELFGKDIVAASEGKISPTASYSLFANMEKKRLLAARRVEKVLDTSHEWMGMRYAHRMIIHRRLYRRGVPLARIHDTGERSRQNKTRLLSNGR